MNILVFVFFDVNDFIRKHTKDDLDKIKETEKKLLQEDKKNVKDK